MTQETEQFLIRMIETCEDAGMRKAFAERLAARARVGKGEVANALQECLDSCDGVEINPSNYNHDDVCNLNNKYVEMFGYIENAIAALSAKAKPIEVGDEHTDDCAINELGDVCDCGVARNIYPMLGTTDTELTRLKRQVEVLREGLLMVASISNDESRCREARTIFAAADRIAKGEV